MCPLETCFWYQNDHKQSQQAQEWPKTSYSLFWSRRCVLDIDFLASVLCLGSFAWLEEKEEINIYGALSWQEPGNMWGVFTRFMHFNTKSETTKGNEWDLVCKDKDTDSERLSVMVKETHLGLRIWAQTWSDARAISAAACWEVDTLSFKTRIQS